MVVTVMMQLVPEFLDTFYREMYLFKTEASKEKTVFLLLHTKILYKLLPLTWLLITRHPFLACPSSILTTPRMHQAEDQRTPLVYTWLMGQLYVVALLELALMSSEEPATGIGSLVMRHETVVRISRTSVKAIFLFPNRKQKLLCLPRHCRNGN